MNVCTAPIPNSKSQSLSLDWSVFLANLQSVLEEFEPYNYLIISVVGSGKVVQFAKDDKELRIEATSNHYLVGSDKLTKSQITKITNLGFHAPTGTPKQSTMESDPCGSPNYFIDYALPISVNNVSNLIVLTLTLVLNVNSPNDLRYAAFSKTHDDVSYPKLGLTKEES